MKKFITLTMINGKQAYICPEDIVSVQEWTLIEGGWRTCIDIARGHHSASFFTAMPIGAVMKIIQKGNK